MSNPITPYLPMETRNFKRADVLGIATHSTHFMQDEQREILLRHVCEKVCEVTNNDWKDKVGFLMDQSGLEIPGPVSIEFVDFLEAYYVAASETFGYPMCIVAAATLLPHKEISELWHYINTLCDTVGPGIGGPSLNLNGCQHCGEALARTSGRPKKFCSNKCRKAAFDEQARQDKLDQKNFEAECSATEQKEKRRG